MHNLLQLMQTTLKLLWGVGKISQSKLSLQSIIATVTQVNDGLLGTNQDSAKCLPAPKSPAYEWHFSVFLTECITF